MGRGIDIDMEYTVSNYKEIMVSNEEIMPFYDFSLVLFCLFIEDQKNGFLFY